MSKYNLLISIIIPTKNEERNIERCLKSILNSDYKNVEIIVVDQNSTDTTKDICEKYGVKFITVPKSETYLPPSNSRNIGFINSTGEYIYHLDADMELSPMLLSEINDIFKDPSVAAIVVPEEDVASNIWSKAKAFERSLYFNTPMEAARVSRRSLFEKIKYDPKITSGEDWNIHDEFSKRGGIRISENKVKHYLGAISLKKEFFKKMNYGSGSINYVKKSKSKLLKLLFQLFYIYFIGISKYIFVKPVVVFAFGVLRVVDFLGLLIGAIKKT